MKSLSTVLTSRKNQIVFIAFLVIIAVVVAMFFYKSTQVPTEESHISDESESSDIEIKIESINQADEADLIKQQGEPSRDFGNCDQNAERKAILDRLTCVKQNTKSKRFWNDMNKAKKEVITLLKKKDTETLSQYLSCEAYDLTWYEMHCEADRIQIKADDFKQLVAYLDKIDQNIVTNGVWRERKPDKQKSLNSGWILRSRLVSKDFQLKGPWKSEPHPVEQGVIIMLEQKLDGKIYIVGIPVTGVELE
ncbi:hypothetical protein KKA14_20315 [bacterium]|nr:hypothetical protein [bacterium]